MNLVYLDEYHFIDTSLLKDSPTFVKIGVVGFTDLDKFRELYPKGRIIAYEADPDNFNGGMRVAVSPIDKFYNKAVGPSGRMDLYRFTNRVSNSNYARHTYDPGCVLKDKIEVSSVTLPEVLRENDLNYLDVLVLNCEGGELQIMHSFEDPVIRSKIGQICVSFHDPRIYPTKEKEAIIESIGVYYNIFHGRFYGGTPDYLMIRKEQ